MLISYSTNQPQLKRDMRAKRKKTRVTRVQMQKSKKILRVLACVI